MEWEDDPDFDLHATQKHYGTLKNTTHDDGVVVSEIPRRPRDSTSGRPLAYMAGIAVLFLIYLGTHGNGNIVADESKLFGSSETVIEKVFNDGTESSGSFYDPATLIAINEAPADESPGTPLPPQSLESVNVTVQGGIPMHALVTVTTGPSRSQYVMLLLTTSQNQVQIAVPYEKVNASSTHNFKVFRVRADTNYILEVYTKNSENEVNGTLYESQTFTMPPSVVSSFNEQFATIISGDFSYQVYMTERSFAGFKGFVGIDRLGYVVWALNMSKEVYASHINDLPSHAMGRFQDGTFAVLTQGTYQLSNIQADGLLLSDVYQPAGYSEGVDSCQVMSHELYVDNSDSTEPIISLRSYAKDYDVLGTKQWGQEVVKWDRTTNVLTSVYDMFDFFDPVTEEAWLDESFDGILDCDFEGDSTSWTVTDYSHCNSVSVGLDDNYIVSSRGLSAILSLHKDGSGQMWRLSSGNVTDFSFNHEDDKFYNQHYVRQLQNGNLIMIDNGNSRPEDTDVEGSSSEYSRAIEYELDFDNMTVTKVWEFKPKDVYSPEGGSIDILESGHRVIMFPFIEIIKDGTPQPASAVYEVSEDGEQLGYMTIPWLSGNPVKDAPTRGFAVAGVLEESDVSSKESSSDSNLTLSFIPSDLPPDSNLTGVAPLNTTGSTDPEVDSPKVDAPDVGDDDSIMSIQSDDDETASIVSPLSGDDAYDQNDGTDSPLPMVEPGAQTYPDSDQTSATIAGEPSADNPDTLPIEPSKTTLNLKPKALPSSRSSYMR